MFTRRKCGNTETFLRKQLNNILLYSILWRFTHTNMQARTLSQTLTEKWNKHLVPDLTVLLHRLFWKFYCGLSLFTAGCVFDKCGVALQCHSPPPTRLVQLAYLILSLNWFLHTQPASVFSAPLTQRNGSQLQVCPTVIQNQACGGWMEGVSESFLGPTLTLRGWSHPCLWGSMAAWFVAPGRGRVDNKLLCSSSGCTAKW